VHQRLETFAHAIFDVVLLFIVEGTLVENLLMVIKLIVQFGSLHICHEALHQFVHCDGDIVILPFLLHFFLKLLQIILENFERCWRLDDLFPHGRVDLHPNILLNVESLRTF